MYLIIYMCEHMFIYRIIMKQQKKRTVIDLCCKPAALVNKQDACRVRNLLPKEEVFYDLSDFFKVFGDTTRIKILECLRRAQLCVCDLAVILNVSPSAVSHQLKILRLSNLVKARKKGKHVSYVLSDSHVSDILEQGLDHVQEGL